MTRNERRRARIDKVMAESCEALETIERMMEAQLKKLERILREEGVVPDEPTKH
jgi:predicted deacylase